MVHTREKWLQIIKNYSPSVVDLYFFGVTGINKDGLASKAARLVIDDRREIE